MTLGVVDKQAICSATWPGSATRRYRSARSTRSCAVSAISCSPTKRSATCSRTEDVARSSPSVVAPAGGCGVPAQIIAAAVNPSDRAAAQVRPAVMRYSAGPWRHNPNMVREVGPASAPMR